MRKYLLASLAICFVIACKKETAQQRPYSVVGNWKWQKTYWSGPLGPINPFTPANTGRTWQMNFSADGNWKKIENDVAVDSGTYSLSSEIYTSPGGTKYDYDQINYRRNGSYLGIDLYKFEKDTLVFAPGVGGTFSSLNVRNPGGTVWFHK